MLIFGSEISDLRRRRSGGRKNDTERNERIALHPVVARAGILELHHSGMDAICRTPRIIGKFVVSKSNGMPLVAVLKPDVHETGSAVHLEIEAINGAKGELKILNVKVRLIYFEVTFAVRPHVTGKLGSDFAIAPDHILEILVECGTVAVDVVVEVQLRQRQQAHESVSHDASDISGRQFRARALDGQRLRDGGCVPWVLKGAIAEPLASRGGVALHVDPPSGGSMSVIHAGVKAGYKRYTGSPSNAWYFVQIHGYLRPIFYVARQAAL
jgi:hypothetical protein